MDFSETWYGIDFDPLSTTQTTKEISFFISFCFKDNSDCQKGWEFKIFKHSKGEKNNRKKIVAKWLRYSSSKWVTVLSTLKTG